MLNIIKKIHKPAFGCSVLALGLAVSTLSFSSLAFSAGEVNPRIIGGFPSSGSAWPSAVALVRTGTNSLYQRQFCGGNLIADRWVLTAAHCLFTPQGDLIDASTLRVASGASSLLDTETMIETVVTNLFVHHQYDPSEANAYHDIAVLELAQSPNQPGMALFSGDDMDAEVGNSATVVGWGATSYTNNSPSGFPADLNQVSVPIVDREVCNQAASYNGVIGPGQICAGFVGGGKDSCVGDSGGPLTMSENGSSAQVGVVSFGIGCALPDKYGVYTNVPYYRLWISDVMGGEIDPGTYQVPDSGDERLLMSSSGSLTLGPLVLFALASGLMRLRRKRR